MTKEEKKAAAEAKAAQVAGTEGSPTPSDAEGQVVPEVSKEKDSAEASSVPKKAGKSVSEKIETNGKFTLFRVNEGFEIKNDAGQLISTPTTEEEGKSLLSGMARFNQ